MTPEELRELRLAEVRAAGDNPRKRWLANKAQEMRLNPTLGEIAMQAILDDTEYTWYSQHIIGKYIVDFYCPALNMIVEVDGSAHYDRVEHDLRRQNWLVSKGYRGIRTTNWQLMKQPEMVALGVNDMIYELEMERSA